MEIKDIIEQGKLEKALERSKKKQDDFTRKEFLKDCYKFWKEYKKVEHPFTWWCYFVTFEYLFFGKVNFFRWIRFYAPKTYVEGSWFENKWQYEWVIFCNDYRFKRKNQPSQRYVWLNYFD